MPWLSSPPTSAIRRKMTGVAEVGERCGVDSFTTQSHLRLAATSRRADRTRSGQEASDAGPRMVRCVRAALPLLRRAEGPDRELSAHLQRQSTRLPAYTAAAAARRL